MTVKSKQPKNHGAGHSDIFQTPEWPVDILMRYIPKKWVIWESAGGEGRLAARIRYHGNEVVETDIASGFDFLSPLAGPMDEFDAIITNPPYSIKTKWLQRCFDLGAPFALLLPMTSLGEQGRFSIFKENGIQILMLPRRVDFVTPSGKGSGAWFYCAWFCHGLDLPDQITFPDCQRGIDFPR